MAARVLAANTTSNSCFVYINGIGDCNSGTNEALWYVDYGRPHL